MTTKIKVYSFTDKATYDATFSPELRAGDLELGWITLDDNSSTFPFPAIVQGENVLAYADDWYHSWDDYSLTDPEDLKELAKVGRVRRGPFISPDDGYPSHLLEDFLPLPTLRPLEVWLRWGTP